MVPVKELKRVKDKYIQKYLMPLKEKENSEEKA